MVGDEPHAVRVGRKALGLFVHVIAQHLDGLLALGHLVGQVVEVPSVAHVEGAVVVFRLFGFGKHEDVGVDRLELSAGHLPKRGRHLHRHVAAVPIHPAVLHPVDQGVRHARVKPVVHAVLPIELGHVPPVGAQWGLQVAEAVQQVVFLVRLGPHAIEGAVVGHPVQNHPQAQRVGLVHKSLEVFKGSVVGVDGVVVLHAVGTSQRRTAGLHDVIVGVFTAFAVDLSNGMHRHQPQNVRAEFLQPRKVWDQGVEGSLWGVLTHVHFVDGRVLGPLGVHQHVGLLAGTQNFRVSRRIGPSTGHQNSSERSQDGQGRSAESQSVHRVVFGVER